MDHETGRIRGEGFKPQSYDAEIEKGISQKSQVERPKRTQRIQDILLTIEEDLGLTGSGLIHEIDETQKLAKEEAKREHISMPDTSLNHRNGETMGILETLFSWIYKPKLLDSTKIVTIRTEEFGTFQLDSRIFPSEFKGLDPIWQRELISQKIEAGGRLCQDILNGDREKEDAKKPTLKDMSDLMWFLQAKAENLEEGSRKIDFFTSKALSVEDPEQRLFAFLTKNTENIYKCDPAYVQDKELQTFQGKTPQGIDFHPKTYYPGLEHRQEVHPKLYLDDVLPYDKCTILFSTSDSNLLIKNVTDSFKNSESRPSNQYDFNHIISTVWEYLLSYLTQKEQISEIEIPVKIKTDYENLIEGFHKEEKDLPNGIVARLGLSERLRKHGIDGDPFSEREGIQVMYARAQSLIKDDLGVSPEMLEQLKNFCIMLEEKYTKENLIQDKVFLTIKALTS